MKTIETQFQAFVQYLETTPASLDFPAVCRRLRILPGELDEYLVRELGVCGDELILLI